MSCHEPGGAQPHNRALKVRFAVSAALAASSALAAAGAGAANWEVAPRIEAGYRYNDNYRLELPGGEIEVSGAEADASLALRTVDPRTQIEIVPRIRATYFPDEDEEDSTDYFLATRFADVTPRRRVGVLGDFSQQDVVRSELPSADVGGDLGDPQAVDSGRILQRNRRDYFRIEPFFGYDLSQRHRVELNAHYLEANFDNQFENAQQDFSEAGAGAGFGWQYSERSSVLLRGVISRYETDFDTDAYGAQVEWASDFSPTSRMYIRVGAQETEPERGPSDTNFVAGIGGRWQGLRNNVFLDLTRNVGPVAAGTVVERHQLRLRVDRDVSPRLVLKFGARVSRDEEIDAGGTYPTREYATAEAGFEWRVLRTLALTARYTYRWQEYEDEPSDASANGFLIGVVYEPRRLD